MKRRNTRILSLLTVICMIAGLLLVPGTVPVANAADITSAIPTATKEYVDVDFETLSTDGTVDSTGFSHNISGTNTNKVEFTTENHYLYLEKNSAENPSITQDLTDVVDSDYIMVSVDLASTVLSGAVLKLTGTSATHTFVTVDANGVISSGDNTNAGTISSKGTFTTVTVAVDSVANTYSVWVGETQAVLDADLPASYGRVTALTIEMAGEVTGSNLMVDNLKVSRYYPVFYNNDFDANASGISLLGATNGVAARAVDEGTGNGYIHLKRADGDSGYPRLIWNYGGNLGDCKQAVYSFKIAVITDYNVYVLFTNGSNGNTASELLFYDSGNNIFKNYIDKNGVNAETASTAFNNLKSWTVGTTYIQFDVAIDQATDTYAIWINGTKTTADYAYNGIIQSLGALTIRTHTIGSELYVDDLAVYAGTEPRDLDPTLIPTVAETYIDNSFETADANGYAELNGLNLSANSDTNKASAPSINHYLSIFQNSTGTRPVVYYDFSDYDVSDYVVVSMDVATTTGGAPFYVDFVDENGVTTSQIVARYGDNHTTKVGGLVMVGSTAVSPSKSVPLDGTWANFTLVVNTVTDTYSFWYNGELCTWSNSTEIALKSSATDFGKLAKIKFSTGWLSSTSSNIAGSSNITDHALMMVDNIRIYSYEQPELAFSGASLTLENNLAIRFNADPALFAEGLYSDPYAVFNFDGKEYTVTDYTVTDTGKYAFQFSNIAPHQIGDTVTATLYATYNGETVSSEPVEYSVLTYCTNKLAAEDSSASLKTLLVDLLNYGAAAQTHKGYKTDSLVNVNADQALASADGTLETHLNTATDTVENPMATWKSATLVLENAVTVRLKFEAKDVTGLTVMINGKQASFVDTGLGDNTYYVYFNGLHAGQMSEVINATVYNGDTAVSNTLSYSIETYAYNKQDVTTDSLGDLVKAMMKYGDSAAAFTG